MQYEKLRLVLSIYTNTTPVFVYVYNKHAIVMDDALYTVIV